MTSKRAMAMVIEGATDRFVFEAHVEHFLAPTLEKGQVVLMITRPFARPIGSASSPRRGARRCGTCPAYSPDLNPKEEAFSKTTTLLKKAARTKGALVEAIPKPSRP